MNTGTNAKDAKVTQKPQKKYRKIPLYGGVRRRRGVVAAFVLTQTFRGADVATKPSPLPQGATTPSGYACHPSIEGNLKTAKNRTKAESPYPCELQSKRGLKPAWELVVGILDYLLCLGWNEYGNERKRRKRRKRYAEAAKEIPKKFPSMEGYAVGGGWLGV